MTIKEELDLICRQNRGVLKPEAVVEFARNPDTALHSRFTWDDAKAGIQYRLWQAREIINVTVTILPQTTTPVRAFVSLKTDRRREGGGYRSIVAVMTNAERRDQLLAEAMEELDGFQQKYKQLSELAPIFEAAKQVKGRRRKSA